jgi:hypothetical protein
VRPGIVGARLGRWRTGEEIFVSFVQIVKH